MRNMEELVIQALKSAARNEQMKHTVQQSAELYPLLWKAAKRYVTGEKRQEALRIAQDFISKDYQISLEFIGENTKDIAECQKAKEELLQLIEDTGALSFNQTVSFDLSHIGLSVNANLAYTNLQELAQKAQQYGISLMISMEESSKTSSIIEVYKKNSYAISEYRDYAASSSLSYRSGYSTVNPISRENKAGKRRFSGVRRYCDNKVKEIKRTLSSFC